MPPRSLAGLRLLITRPEGTAADAWATALAERGAVPVRFPTVSIVPPESWQAVDRAAARLSSYHWLVLTSQQAVAFFSSRLPGGRFPEVVPPRIAAVGTATARGIVERGGQVALVPVDQRQEGLRESLLDALAETRSSARVLFPVAAEGRTLLVEALRAAGVSVDVVTVYRTTVKPDMGSPPPFDVAIFASPSALRAFVDTLGTQSLDGKVVAVVGPTTAEAAHACGLLPAVATAPTVEALAEAVVHSLSLQGGSHVVS